MENGSLLITKSAQSIKINPANGTGPTEFPNTEAQSVDIGSSTGVISFWTTGGVGYNKLICGSIWARDDIHVEGPDPWGDYVFDANYDLMPLDELEIFIEENKHLPEIPSASEIVENGIKLAEMDAKQMVKIEELTLYVIEQQKQIIEMQKSIDKLNNK